MDFQITKDGSFDKVSDYLWMNIESGGERIGKVRVTALGKKLIVNSINIFPEFERKGYGRTIINLFKNDYDGIVADKVRNAAIGFWEKMDFHSDINGNFIWEKIQQKKCDIPGF